MQPTKPPAPPAIGPAHSRPLLPPVRPKNSGQTLSAIPESPTRRLPSRAAPPPPLCESETARLPLVTASGRALRACAAAPGRPWARKGLAAVPVLCYRFPIVIDTFPFEIFRNTSFVFPSGLSVPGKKNTRAGTVKTFFRSFPTVFIPTHNIEYVLDLTINVWVGIRI